MGTSPCCANRQPFPYCVENMIYKLVFVLASLYAITASPIVPEDSMVEVFTEVQTEAALNMELLTEVVKHPIHVQYQALGLLKMANAQNGGEPYPTDDLQLWDDEFSQQGFIKKAWRSVKRTARRTYRRAKRTVRRTYRRAKRTVKRHYRRAKRTARRHYRRVKRTVRRTYRSVKRTGRRAWEQGKRSVKKGWRKVKKVAGKAHKLVKKGWESVKKGAKVVAEAVKKAGRIIGAHMKRMAGRLCRKAIVKVGGHVVDKLFDHAVKVCAKLCIKCGLWLAGTGGANPASVTVGAIVSTGCGAACHLAAEALKKLLEKHELTVERLADWICNKIGLKEGSYSKGKRRRGGRGKRKGKRGRRGFRRGRRGSRRGRRGSRRGSRRGRRKGRRGSRGRRGRRSSRRNRRKRRRGRKKGRKTKWECSWNHAPWFACSPKPGDVVVPPYNGYHVRRPRRRLRRRL